MRANLSEKEYKRLENAVKRELGLINDFPWEQRHIRQLKKLYRTISITDIATIMGRSYNSVEGAVRRFIHNKGQKDT